jgi:hypothetical protein
MQFKLLCFLTLLLGFSGCSNDSNYDNDSSDNSDNDDDEVSSLIPLSIYESVYGTTSDIYIEEDWIYINTNGVPDHQSPYFINTQWEDAMYVAYDGSNPFVTNFNLNPNRISELALSFKIPAFPEQSSANNPTPMGPIGVALNGIPFYNQYAGPNNPLTNEINSFDQYNGHPAPLGPGQENGTSGKYHYHLEPFWLTTNEGKEALIGFLLDGFPVYGPEENGQTIVSSDLDEYHGHFTETADFPDGMYHYHVTAGDPYINGSGYYGSPGTVSE